MLQRAEQKKGQVQSGDMTCGLANIVQFLKETSPIKYTEQDLLEAANLLPQPQGYTPEQLLLILSALAEQTKYFPSTDTLQELEDVLKQTKGWSSATIAQVDGGKHYVTVYGYNEKTQQASIYDPAHGGFSTHSLSQKSLNYFNGQFIQYKE